MSIIHGIGPVSGRLPRALENVAGLRPTAITPVCVATPHNSFASSWYTGACSRIHAYASRAPFT